jgi:hypothetical protein
LEEFEENLLLIDFWDRFGICGFLIGLAGFGYGESGVDLGGFVGEFGFEGGVSWELGVLGGGE